MAFDNVDTLPNEVKEQLPYGAQTIFMTAFNSANSDGMSEDGAMQVAWNSVKTEYEPSDNGGQWRRIREGGTRAIPTATMPQA